MAKHLMPFETSYAHVPPQKMGWHGQTGGDEVDYPVSSIFFKSKIASLLCLQPFETLWQFALI